VIKNKQPNTIRAEVILDSLSAYGVRLTTVKLTIPSFMHTKVLQHRAFSRTSVAGDKPGEISILMTGTDFSEFRIHDESDDLVKRLNQLVHGALEASKPKTVPPTGIHMPYIHPQDVDEALRHAVEQSTGAFHIDDFEVFLEQSALSFLQKQSVVRCFRQTEFNRQHKMTVLEDDLETFDKMIKLGDAFELTVMEHVAKPDARVTIGMGTRWTKPWLHANYNGWNQFKLEWVGINGTLDATVLDLYEALRANEIEVDRLTRNYMTVTEPTAVDPAA
jgi:hypothetical protein